MLDTVDWSPERDYKTGSEDEPLQFYIDSLCNSSSFDLLLGYFSSTAISVLSLGFTNFLYAGGMMRMVINNVLSEKDKEAIQKGERGGVTTTFNLEDIRNLKDTLSEYGVHFFECLAWLIANKRIQIKIIQPKELKGISHYKSGIFSDGKNKVGFKASCNFTAYGLLENLEHLDCFMSWEDKRSNQWINSQSKYFEQIFDGQADFVEYLQADQVSIAITEEFGEKSLNDLIVQEKYLIEKSNTFSKNTKLKRTLKKATQTLDHFEELESQPKFPFGGKPREYQIQAYTNWVANDYKGIFAMATGTGKTITSLNCLLEEYKKNNFYRFIVLVPTISLATQWENEITKKFNFGEIVLCSSNNNTWEETLRSYGLNLNLGRNLNFCILTTYATFRGRKFQKLLNTLFNSFLKDITLIADEAHTLGAPQLLKLLPYGIQKRIGLTATPERRYDSVGEAELYNFFGTSLPNYTYSYNMKKAIADKILCPYYYHPVIVELDSEELLKYRDITKKLLKFINPKTGLYKDEPYVNNLLIQRKNIVHKARNKAQCLVNIIETIGKDNFRRAFIYVPEGYETNYEQQDYEGGGIDIEDEEKIINEYTLLLYDRYKFKLKQFTGETKERESVLKQFSDGKLDALLAMKCLDEGVDIPQTKIAIFCSSTGNPRQYIQRRGRVLRYHVDKESAVIYDMIVKPNIDITSTDLVQKKLDKNIFRSELSRVVNFAVLAENKLDVLKSLEHLCYSFDIDIYDLAILEEGKYNE